MIIKNVKCVVKIVTAFLNTHILKMIKYNTNVYVVTKIMKKTLMKTYRNDFLIHANFLTKMSISLYYCCKDFFTHMN